jgi:transient receptor potential cation channel subfamily M protein 3
MVTPTSVGHEVKERMLKYIYIFFVFKFDNNISWIQRTFKKRECIKFIPLKTDQQLVGRCCCGRDFLEHNENIQLAANNFHYLSIKKDERWSVAKHTRCESTDAFGVIEFEGMAHPTKAQVRRKTT